ncbi:GlpM family protein, partial [Lonsdalea populi]
MAILLKAVLGALVVVLIGLLAKTRNYYIAGLVPLFPTFALIAHYIVGTERGLDALRSTILFGIWSVIPYLIYLISLYYFTDMMK